MSYVKQTWADDDATKPLSAARMNYIETGIEGASTARSQLASGESTIPRTNIDPGNANSPSAASGRLIGAYFTADKTETINKVATWCQTAAGATPTLIRFGVYSVASNGDLTLVASTPSDTTLLAAGATRYEKALSSSWAKTAGVRYCVALLVVTTETAPKPYGLAPWVGYAEAPALGARLDSQTDLPASIPASSLNAAPAVPYFEVTP